MVVKKGKGYKAEEKQSNRKYGKEAQINRENMLKEVKIWKRKLSKTNFDS
jgi:hypothetical protein